MRSSRRSSVAVRGGRRDRRGRGLRGALAPRTVPRNRTRGEVFDTFVLDAVEELEEHWAAELADVEFAVEDVPVADPASDFDPEVVLDRGVPLGRLVRPAAGGAESATTIVVYRRPVEARAHGAEDRADLIFMIVAELVAELLGKDIDEIDP